MPEIDIAVPSYNCAPWIDAFFESVIAQDFTDWRVVARDDASTDGTAARLVWWQSRLGDRMIIVDGSGARNLGMVGNYDAVLAATSAPFVMFADPDDVWRPGKMVQSQQAMRKAEATAGAAVPVIVCTDAQVVDDEQRPISPSYWKWSRMNPTLGNTLHRLAVESPVLTSTMMVNRALLRLALPLTGCASCPDWWPALVAGAFGRIVYVPERSVLYRRHPTNDSLDPFGSSLVGAVRRILMAPGEPRRRVARLIRQFAPQAGAFVDRFRDRLRPRDLAAVEAAARLPSLGALARRWTVIRYDLWFSSPLKNFGLLLLM
jgi:glycosyltransferase involved in cell wall biosynthesis